MLTDTHMHTNTFTHSLSHTLLLMLLTNTHIPTHSCSIIHAQCSYSVLHSHSLTLICTHNHYCTCKCTSHMLSFQLFSHTYIQPTTCSYSHFTTVSHLPHQYALMDICIHSLTYMHSHIHPHNHIDTLRDTPSYFQHKLSPDSPTNH
jgi:hypothetical protein